MIGPCGSCKYWKFANTIHEGWGHCYRAQEMTETEYNTELDPDDEAPRMVAIGGKKESGIFATEISFECNEYQRKR